MTVQERIIEKVKAITDPEILNEILDLISAESEMEEVFEVSPKQRVSIEEGLNDVKNGDTYSQENSNKIISLWFQEKLDGPVEQ